MNSRGFKFFLYFMIVFAAPVALAGYDDMVPEPRWGSSQNSYGSNASGTLYINAEGANFRSAPFINGSRVFSVLKRNSPLKVIYKSSYSDSGSWYFVRDTNGREGWVSARVVSKNKTMTPAAK